MGLRLWKSIRLLPGFQLNLSKSGASLSVGKQGLTANIGKKGVRTTVGFPGSGISYSSYRLYKTEGSGSGGRGFGLAALLSPGGMVLIGLVAAVFYAVFFG